MSKAFKLAVIVPVYNEELRIEYVLNDLILELNDYITDVFVIDDCSTDSTNQILESFREIENTCKVYRNKQNLGHGPSVMRGLNLALKSSADHFLTYDGDGFLSRSDIREAICGTDPFVSDAVIEMVRTGRRDPGYRKLVTSFLKILVLVATGKTSADPNSPSRLMNRNQLILFLQETSGAILVPNLWFSIFARRNGFRLVQKSVRVETEPSLDIRNSWNSKLKKLPSKGFLIFCLKAIKIWTWKSH
jgi:dolichol-phosphate mannosyltransferase